MNMQELAKYGVCPLDGGDVKDLSELEGKRTPGPFTCTYCGEYLFVSDLVQHANKKTFKAYCMKYFGVPRYMGWQPVEGGIQPATVRDAP